MDPGLRRDDRVVIRCRLRRPRSTGSTECHPPGDFWRATFVFDDSGGSAHLALRIKMWHRALGPVLYLGQLLDINRIRELKQPAGQDLIDFQYFWKHVHGCRLK